MLDKARRRSGNLYWLKDTGVAGTHAKGEVRGGNLSTSSRFRRSFGPEVSRWSSFA
jgi:hypothetical protein